MNRRVSDLVAESLVAHRVDRAFCVPGESFLPLLDALIEHPSIDLVTCRHEGAGALAAIADAKLTGRPGVVMVSRGPGLCNAALALHVASQEAIPLIVLMGQVDTPMLGRDAVQEIDTKSTFSGTVKWTCRLSSPDGVAEQVARAFTVASSGTPGAVIVELPEDILSLGVQSSNRPRVHGVARPSPSSLAVRQAAAALTQSTKPLLIVGGECRTGEFRDALLRLSDAWRVPVIVTNKNQDQYPNDHTMFVGQLGIFVSSAHIRLFEESDLILAIGTRLGDLSSMGFQIPRQMPSPQKLIHVYPDPNSIGRHFTTHIPIISSSMEFVTALSEENGRSGTTEAWISEISAVRRAHHTWIQELAPESDVLGHTIAAIANLADDNSVVTTDSGNFAAWVHRIFRFQTTQRLLGSACGAMGTGVPSGLAACLRFPERQVIAFCGDGGFLMTGNELAVAVDRQLPMKIVVSNNKSYGTIRSYQERAYPRRIKGTDLSNPDFCTLARAYGATGFTIKNTSEAARIVEDALACPGPAIIDVYCAADQTLDRSVNAFRTTH